MTDYRAEIRSLHLEEEYAKPQIEIETAILAYGSKIEIPEGQIVRLTKGGSPDKRYLKRPKEYREYISHYMKEMYRDRPELCREKARPMFEANKGKPWSEERKKARSELQKNYIWITDGTQNKRVRNDSQIPEGWRRGRSDINPDWRRKIADSRHQNHLKKLEDASKD